MNDETDKNLNIFIELINKCLAVIKNFQENCWNNRYDLLYNYMLLSKNLTILRKNAAAGKLPRPSRDDVPFGSGLGVGKWVEEWCDNENIVEALHNMENYYRFEF